MRSAFLRNLPLFAGLSDADLEWLAEQAKPISIKAGELLIEEGAPGDSAFVVLDGEFEIIKKSDQRDIVIALREPGAVIGEMALLDRTPRSASVRAVRDSSLLQISDAVFFQLIEKSAAAVKAILQTVSGRLRQNEGMLRQSEKMAALGTLSAGLAHELNNPAAAARRSAEQLRETLGRWQDLTTAVDRLGLTAQQLATLHDLRTELARGSTGRPALDPMVQSELESDLQAWLEERGMDDAWELAPVLVGAGWESGKLTELCKEYSADQLTAVARWLAAGCSVFALLDEVHTSADRISQIVKSVKEYSYLDQAPVQNVNIHDGLENTLVILRHKTKDGVKIVKQYAAELPKIEAYGSELNQVWTNILDNAIDAMKGNGEITIRTSAAPGHVVVAIQDNGSGIPEEIQKRIFEPFYTTKPPGVGTGLGLHIAYTIVHKHHGEITLRSRPGETCFEVKLPTQLARGKG